MKVLHVSAECYPAAKAGGLGDVVGALPKYLNTQDFKSGAIIPKYGTPWLVAQEYTTVYTGTARLHNQFYPFTIQKEKRDQLGFPFFVADIPGLFDRPGVYADNWGNPFGDEIERSLCFQQAVLQWVVRSPGTPDIIHCHDHHTALIPFMMQYCPEYSALKGKPSVFTIHNGEYHGGMGWDRMYLLPFIEENGRYLLDWYNTINPLAAGVKCAWRLTTVSPSYLNELMENSNGMESLIRHEQFKARGILNGIDAQVWDPKTDPLIEEHLEENIVQYKWANKKALGRDYALDFNLPVVTFIGRLVGEKGADLLPDLIRTILKGNMQVAFALLGTGEQSLHNAFTDLKKQFPNRFDVVLGYDERLAHQLYAGSDFLIMPSRVEPCGLNQMYAMRYGTIPIVRETGGLRDTVIDIGELDGTGRGVRFMHFTIEDAQFAIYRAVQLYKEKENFKIVRKRVMDVDFSWENAARNYIELYKEML